MSEQSYPKDWDQDRVRRVLDHYESQTADEALAEDEAAYDDATHTLMDVPTEMVPEIRELIRRRRGA